MSTEYENLLSSLEAAINEKYDNKIKALNEDRQHDLDDLEYFRSLETYAKERGLSKYTTDIDDPKDLLKMLYPTREVSPYGWVSGIERWTGGSEYLNSVKINKVHGILEEEGFIDTETGKVLIYITYKLPSCKDIKHFYYY